MGQALAHWELVCDKHKLLMEFFEYLEDRCIRLDFSDSAPHDLDEEKPHNLANKFLDVDARALEEERRELLEIQRRANEGQRISQADLQAIGRSPRDLVGEMQTNAARQNAAEQDAYIFEQIKKASADQVNSMTYQGCQSRLLVLELARLGICPQCGDTGPHRGGSFGTALAFGCRNCRFQVSRQEATQIIADWVPYMRQHVNIFLNWREQRKDRGKEEKPHDSVGSPAGPATEGHDSR